MNRVFGRILCGALAAALSVSTLAPALAQSAYPYQYRPRYVGPPIVMARPPIWQAYHGVVPYGCQVVYRGNNPYTHLPYVRPYPWLLCR